MNPACYLGSMSRPTPPAYNTRTWPAHNEALKRRGSLTIWFDPAMTREAAPPGKRGRQPEHSDAAIQACLTMKVLFGMALRQTAGLVVSLLRLIGVDWETLPPICSHLANPGRSVVTDGKPPRSGRASGQPAVGSKGAEIIPSELSSPLLIRWRTGRKLADG